MTTLTAVENGKMSNIYVLNASEGCSCHFNCDFHIEDPFAICSCRSRCYPCDCERHGYAACGCDEIAWKRDGCGWDILGELLTREKAGWIGGRRGCAYCLAAAIAADEARADRLMSRLICRRGLWSRVNEGEGDRQRMQALAAMPFR